MEMLSGSKGDACRNTPKINGIAGWATHVYLKVRTALKCDSDFAGRGNIDDASVTVAKLLLAIVLQVLYSERPKRQLMERIQ
jgi:hypothetical protein